jgi:hypothetical protein
MGMVFAIPHLNRRVDDEIRRRVEAQFAQHYDDLKVTVRSAELVPGRGILVRGLAVVEPGAEGPRAELADVDEVFISCATDLEKLVQGEPEITRVVFRRPTLRATRRPDGSWSVARLLHPRRAREKTPEVLVENGVLDVFDPTRNPSTSVAVRDVNLTVKPCDDSVSGAAGGRNYAVQGTLTGDMVRQVGFSGTFDPWVSRWSLAGTAEGLELSPELYRALPEQWAARLDTVRSLRGQGKLDFRVEHDAKAVTPYRFRCTGQLTRGRLEDARLPRPLTDIRGTIVCTEQGVTIERLAARCGQATVQVSGRRSGYDQQGPATLKAEIRSLDLDQELRDALPERLREQWHRYLPTGQVHADLTAVFDGQAWRPELAVQCVAVAFTYDKFPYRLERGQGSLTLKDDVLSARLTAYSGNQPVRVKAEMRQPLSEPCGWAEARGEDIRIDEKLIDAIPGKARAVIRSMEPRGTVGFFARAWRDKPEGPFHRNVLVGLNRCAIRYEKFPYQISAIRGTMEMSDGDWSFRDLEGAHGAGRITGEGSLTATPEGNRLLLRLAGAGIPLEEELRDALKPGMQQMWNNVQPQGAVDLGVEIAHLSSRDHFTVHLRAEPRRENSSIKPTYFPYRLENLRGVLTYRDGHVTLEQFRGEHGNTRVASAGECDFDPDGSWRLRLDELDVERLRLDRELAGVLPGRLKKAISELNPTGPVRLHGAFALGQSGRPGDPLTTEWDLQVGYQQASIDFGLRLENLNGEVRLTGACDGDHFWSRGELAVDSAMYKDFQVTQITGPVWIDDQRILFGTWVDRPQPGQPAPEEEAPPPRSIRGQLFGGAMACDGWVALDATPRYSLRAELTQGDLKRCVQEMGSGSRDLRGTIRAQVQLHGSGRTLNLLGGNGKIELSDADVYELPVMIALLKRLGTRRPDRSAFSQSDIDFRIEGNHIYFDRIKFTGDTMSLVGAGEMNFQSDIRLTLHAMVGRGERDLPLLHDLLGGASQQLMLIHVGGTLQNPETRREPFPGVARALQQLQSAPDAQVRPPRKR